MPEKRSVAELAEEVTRDLEMLSTALDVALDALATIGINNGVVNVKEIATEAVQEINDILHNKTKDKNDVA